MAEFATALSKTLQFEGGYQNHISDNGNYNSLNQLIGTNYGISAKTLEAWLGKVPTVSDMKNLSIETAKAIYRKWYWDANRLSFINDQNIANQLFDIAVLHGSKNMATIVQRSLNQLQRGIVTIDGVFGVKTRDAINLLTRQGLGKDLNSIIVLQRRSFLANNSQTSIFTGWLTRIDSFMNYETIKTASSSLAIALLFGGMLFF